MFVRARLIRMLVSLAVVGGVFARGARADIYQWEYVNPADHSQGKQASAIPCLNGVGVSAQPWASLSNHNLQFGYFIGADLRDANLFYTDLTDADFSNANLQETLFGWARLENTNFTGADVRVADFEGTVQKGFTAAQLYSTASYQAGDIHGIDLGYNDLSGWSFQGKNLSGGVLENATLTNVNFSQADLRNVMFDESAVTNADFSGAIIQAAIFSRMTGFTASQLYSTASYQTGDLAELQVRYQDVTGWNFAGKNLTDARFYQTKLTGVNLAGAIVRGTGFEDATSSGFTAAQLYSTASYQAGDLTGINLESNNLQGWNFAGQNLSKANFNNSTVTNADFTNATITGAALGKSYGDQISASQLYSTASYQAGDLTEVGLAGDNLSGWNFAGLKLTKSSFAYANLTGTNLSNANLNGANLYGATLTNANLSGADIRGTDLRQTTSHGFTAAQLYSTASYQAKDLTGHVSLSDNYLIGWNFAQQNLTHASFQGSTLTNAIFSQANLTDAYFVSAGLGNTNLSQANLTRANLRDVTLTGAVLTGANVEGADFGGTTSRGFTATQLYSTASYQSGELSGLGLFSNNLTGWNFAGKTLIGAYLGDSNLTNVNLSNANLTGATFSFSTMTNVNLAGAVVRKAQFSGVTDKGFTAAQLYSTASYQAKELSETQWVYDDLTGWNFAGQNLTNAAFNATITNSDFTAADTRGARYFDPNVPINTNLIRPDGSIHSLQLTGGKSLVVRDFDGDTSKALAPIPIRVENAFTMDATGTLRLRFGGDAWGSLISFAAGVPVQLGGTLALEFAADVNLVSQIGQTIRVFDWAGVAPAGTFAVASSFAWDLSRLYTTGEITLLSTTALAGDFNDDGRVDGGDYIAWRKAGGTQGGFDIWRASLGSTPGHGSGGANVGGPPTSPSVPEPVAGALALLSVIGAATFARVGRRESKPIAR